MTTKCTGITGRIFGHKWLDCYRIRYLFPHFLVRKGCSKKELKDKMDQWSGIDDCFSEWKECPRCGAIKDIFRHKIDGDSWLPGEKK